MSDKNNNFNIGDLASTASAYSAESEERRENERKRKLLLLKFGAMGILTAIIIIIGSIAWFTMSEEVEGTGANMTADDLPFEIAAKGTEGVRNQSFISALAPGYQPGEFYTYNGVTYSVTSGNTDSIRLQYSSGDSEIGPGGSGVCDLYLKSKIDGKLTLKIDMNVVSYANVDKFDIVNGAKVSDGNGGYRTTPTLTAVSDINYIEYNITEPELTALRNAASYLSGHIMFYKEPYSGEDNYSYIEPLTNRMRKYTNNNAEDGAVYHVPIYWMWSNTLGQLAIQTNVNSLRSGKPVVEETAVDTTDDAVTTDKEAVLEYLWSNKGEMFADATAITREMIFDADTEVNFRELSAQYNAADYAIGTNIAYFLIELTVTNDNTQQ